MNDAILAILVLLPVVITFFLKSNAALGFLAVCAGYAIVSLAGGDINGSIDKLNLNGINNSYISIAILTLPLLSTLFFSGRSWASRAKMIMNLVAAAASGLVLLIVSAPFINDVANVNLYDSAVWPLVQHARGSIVVAGTIYALVLVWFSKTRHPDKKKHK